MSTRSPSSSRWSLPDLPAQPTCRITSSSFSGTEGSVRFGSVTSRASSSALARRASSSAGPTCSFSGVERAIASLASSPARLSSPTCLPAAFCSAFSSSARVVSARQRSSAASTWSTASATPSPPRRASAAFTPSGSRRMSLRSRTADLPLALLRRRRLRAGVLRHERGHLLRVLPNHHVRRHDRALEAAVAAREQHVLHALLAEVEIGTVRALLLRDVGGRAVRGRGAERVTAATALVEQHRSLMHRAGGLVVVGVDLLLTARRDGKRNDSRADGGPKRLRAEHGRAY